MKVAKAGLRRIKRDIVSAVILSADNKILLGKQDPAKPGVYMDCWHIPGGGIEPGESREQALIREVKEETGLDIKGLRISLLNDRQKGSSERMLKGTKEKVMCEMSFSTYLVELSLQADEVRLDPSDDLIEFIWAEISDLPNLKLTPPSIELFREMRYL